MAKSSPRQITNAARADARGVTPDSRDVALGAGTSSAAALGGQQPNTTRSIDVAPSPDAGQGLSLQTRATALVVVDRGSHEQALELIRGAKQLKRAIEDHWSKITRGVDELKRNLLGLKNKDLAPIEAALAVLTERALTYSNAEERRARAEEETRRRAAEELARVDREAALALQELEAARFEESSPQLSARERIFVDQFMTSHTLDTRLRAQQAAHWAKFADPAKAGARLIRTPKILEAIGVAQQALELRRQSAAVKQQPLNVVAPPKVDRQVGYVPGTSKRTTYAAEVTDPVKFILAYLAGDIPTDAMVPNQVWLNKQAGDLKEKFEQAFPGVSLVKKETIAG